MERFFQNFFSTLLELLFPLLLLELLLFTPMQRFGKLRMYYRTWCGTLDQTCFLVYQVYNDIVVVRDSVPICVKLR